MSFRTATRPGSERKKRWQDVQVLLDVGIDVLTTMNIQHLESLNDQVWRITGVRVRETIPNWVMEQADQAPDAARLAESSGPRSGLPSGENTLEALRNFFQESTLVALRNCASPDRA